MKHVRLEGFEIPLNAAREPHGNLIFLARGKRNRRDADQVSNVIKCRVFDRWRIDSNFGALAEQIFDKAVEGLVGAVPYIIIVAREKGDAKIAGFHGRWL